MTPEEKLEIVSEVLEAIKAFSTTIPQMTEVTSVPADAYVELNGGRKISVQTLINEAVTRALAQANITALNQRMTALADEVSRQIRSLGNVVDEIPIITVDDALSTSSENPVQNKVITNAINTMEGVVDAFMSIPHVGDVPAIEQSGFSMWTDDCELVTGNYNGNVFVFLKYVQVIMGQRMEPKFYHVWSQHPEGHDSEYMNKPERLYAVEGNIYQGVGGNSGPLRPLGAMLAQHNILSQEDYNNLSDSQKDNFSIYMTY